MASTDKNLLAWVRSQLAFAADHLSNVTPKTAASFNIASLLAVIIAMSLWQPGLGKSVEQAALAPLAPQPVAVKMIDAAPRGAECREQTWPYIDRNCLNYGSPQPESVARVQESTPQPAIQAVQPVAVPVVPPLAQTLTQQSAIAPEDDLLAGEDEPEYFGPTDEELREQARAEARQRRRAARRHHGHFSIGPFRF